MEHASARGRAVQGVDHVKPTLKALGSKRLKPQHEKLLSKFALNFNLRRYTEVRDQCDALFLGNELLTRGVFLPLSYGAKDSLFWTPILKPGSVGGGAQPRHADSSHPPRVELHFIACPLLVS